MVLWTKRKVGKSSIQGRLVRSASNILLYRTVTILLLSQLYRAKGLVLRRKKTPGEYRAVYAAMNIN